jgi:thioesterase domain-containing protein
LSERIDSGAASDALSVLLPLRERGHGTPLFCIHPAGGFSWPYAGLLRYLPERPLFALQARSLRGESAAGTIEAMASDYLAQIRTVQPHGPYHLLGWSLGCHIAHAIATQLQERGEHVEQLIMLDGYPIPSDAAFAAPSEQDIMQGLIHALCDAPLPITDSPLTLGTVKARLVESSDGVLTALGDGVVEAIFGEFKVAPALAASFKPRTYRGDVLFFRAVQTDAGPFVSRTPAAWQPYVDGHIEAYEIDCAHEAMMRPHALAQIGPRLASVLQRETAS